MTNFPSLENQVITEWWSNGDLKATSMRHFRLKPKSISEFLVQKTNKGGEKSQIPILPEQTLEEQKTKCYALATLCLFQGRALGCSIKVTF